MQVKLHYVFKSNRNYNLITDRLCIKCAMCCAYVKRAALAPFGHRCLAARVFRYIHFNRYTTQPIRYTCLVYLYTIYTHTHKQHSHVRYILAIWSGHTLSKTKPVSRALEIIPQMGGFAGIFSAQHSYICIYIYIHIHIHTI